MKKMKWLMLLKISTALFLFSGCQYEADYQSRDPVIQQGLAKRERLEDEMATLSKEINQYNQEYDQLNKEIQQHKEQFEEYQKHSNVFLMSLNEDQLELFKKFKNETQSWSQTGSASLSAGLTLAFRDFDKSLSEKKSQTWMELGDELLKLQEKHQELVARAVKLDEQGEKLNRRREQLIRQQEQNRQFALEYMKILPYKWQQQQRELDRFNENWQRQLDRQYYGQPVIPLSPQWPTYYRDAFGNYRPR